MRPVRRGGRQGHAVLKLRRPSPGTQGRRLYRWLQAKAAGVVRAVRGVPREPRTGQLIVKLEADFTIYSEWADDLAGHQAQLKAALGRCSRTA